jgi:hypothetical protein
LVEQPAQSGPIGLDISAADGPLLHIVPLEHRVGLEAVHPKNPRKLKVAELPLPEKFHRVRFLRVGIQIRILAAELFFDILGQFDGYGHAQTMARAGEFVHAAPLGALPSEQLAAENGWYDGDPKGRIGQLNAELFRAKRLVADTAARLVAEMKRGRVVSTAELQARIGVR